MSLGTELNESAFAIAAKQVRERLASSGTDSSSVMGCADPRPQPAGLAATVVPEGAEAPLPSSPETAPLEVPVTAPTTPTGRPGAARNGGGSLHRIRPHWRYTRTAGDAICGPCAWVLLYHGGRFITASIASGFVGCARCGRLEA